MCKNFRINGYKKMLILKGLTITYTITNFLIDFVFYVGFIRDFLGLVLYNEKMVEMMGDLYRVWGGRWVTGWMSWKG